MAQPNTVNPYSAIGALLAPGLDAIIASLPGTPTIDDLVTQVNNYIQSEFYSSATTQVQIEIGSVCYHAINSFRNNLVLNGQAMYNSKQMPLYKC